MKRDVKDSAREIRKVLKSGYPGIKFSVRAKRFAGGSSVDVSWTDGPTESEVSKATAHLKGYHNGFYNEFIITYRQTSREVMEAAAKAAAEYYEVEMPKVVGNECPYIEGQEIVDEPTFPARSAEAISSKIHRAVWNTSVYDIDVIEAFKSAFPN